MSVNWDSSQVTSVSGGSSHCLPHATRETMTISHDEIIGHSFSSPGQPLEGDSENALSKQIEAEGQEGEQASPGAASLLCEQSDMPHMLDVQMNWGAPWCQLRGDLTGGGGG